MFNFNDFEITIEDFYDDLLNDEPIEVDWSYVEECIKQKNKYLEQFK